MRMARPYAARLNVVKENGDLVTYCEVKETRRDAYKRALPDGIAEKTGSALSQAIQCGEPRLQPSCAPAGFDSPSGCPHLGQARLAPAVKCKKEEDWGKHKWR
jgi:hypothetical protein